VELVKTGPWSTQVSMRGLSGERVALMVDGVRVNSVRGHGVEPSLVPLDRLDGVEVMPGASSSQFGTDAMGGAINFVTHRNLLEDQRNLQLVLAARASEPGNGNGGSARLTFASPRVGVDLAGGLSALDALVTPSGSLPNSSYRDQDLGARVSLRLGNGLVDYEHTHHAALDVGLPAFGTAVGFASGANYPLQSREADRL